MNSYNDILHAVTRQVLEYIFC